MIETIEDYRSPGLRLAVLFIVILLLMTASARENNVWSSNDLFEPAITVSLGGPYPTRTLESGDFNEDGFPDLIVGHKQENGVTILIGTGDGNFEIGHMYPLEYRPQSLTVGDVDGDGHLDFAVIIWTDWELIVFRGNGRGGFAEEWFYPGLDLGSCVELGDTGLDGDNDLDLVITLDYQDELLLFTNEGGGYFSPDVSIPTGANPLDVIFADVNGNGLHDMVVSELLDDQISVFINSGGNYDKGTGFPVWSGPKNVCAGDLDKDNDLDLVVPCFDDSVYILENDGSGSFAAPISIENVRIPTKARIGDFDRNGNQDFAVSHYGRNGVSVYFGNGDLSFPRNRFFEAGERTTDLTAADFDGDLDLDLAAVNEVDGTISILINTTLTPRSIVTGPGPGENNPPLVRVFPARQYGQHEFEFPAYGASSYGVKVSCGDLNGDGMDAIITGAGPGAIYGPHVRGFQPDGTPLDELSFLAYGTNKWGVNVASGDVDGDGFDEIVTGAGPGELFGPHVRGWDYDGSPPVTALQGVNFFAYGTPKWGVNVATGDIDGDGYDEILTGPGPGAVYGPHVRGWNVDGGSAAAMPAVSFLAFGTNMYGVEVSCGDVDGDGIDEIVTSAGPGALFGAHVRGWNHDGTGITQLAGLSFLAWPPEHLRYGARVHSGTDLNGDFRTDMVVGPGPDSRAGTPVKVFSYDGECVVELFSLEAFPGLTHGTSVSAGSF